ncbi:MAG TPA: PKD domain-containing protein, partial [Candidatus Hydrogenedentes bacterium]|nr:PKD domain-containing protein [Candidatus Hydrogenedentota bacterium]
TNSSSQFDDVTIIVGANPAVLIDGETGVPGLLASGETWTTCVPAGAYISVPGASGTGPGDGPVALFSASPTSGSYNLAVAFFDQSLPGAQPIHTWEWSFGDGDTSAEQNPVHSYTAAGVYHVSLSVTSDIGTNILTKTNYITVTEPIGPTANFSGGPTDILTGGTVFFGDASQPGTALITNWAWTFGDGETSTLKSPSHVYAAPGVYEVSLTVTTSVGSDTKTVPGFVVVSEPPAPVPPVADFTAWPTSITIGETVQFADMSLPGSTPITGWTWDFGDGEGGIGQAPVHVFNSAGLYDVALTVTSDSGSNLVVKSGYIHVIEPGGPTANFMGVPTVGTRPLMVSFTDLSLPGDEPITSWQLDFGDGGVSTEPNPVYTYANTGVYSVTLIVTTLAGADQRIRNNYVTVTAPKGPTAEFSAVPTGGMKPLTVQFVDLSAPGDRPITGWAWNFGDGGASTEPSPTHVYNSAGAYTVQLTVTTEVGSDDKVVMNFINVTAPGGPTADFTGYPASGDAPLTVQFASQSQAGDTPITSWSWTFGDGAVSAEQAPVHTYANAGNYTVRLTVTASDSSSDEEIKTNFVVANTPDALTANFVASATTGPAPLTVQFADLSATGSLPITSWAWDFGDGNTSEQQHPQHTYEIEGAYTVKLTVTTAVETDTMEKAAYITVTGAMPAAGMFGLLALAIASAAVGTRALRTKKK